MGAFDFFPLAPKCEAAQASIRELPGVDSSNVKVAIVDLSSLKSVMRFTGRFKKRNTHLHMLVLNAGVMHPPYTLSKDGIELQWAVNHVAHQLMAQNLLPLLERSQPSTVVSVSSNGQFQTLQPVDIILDAKALSAKDSYNKVDHYG